MSAPGSAREAMLDDYFAGLTSSPGAAGKVGFVVRNAGTGLRVLRAMRALPELRLDAPDDPAGRIIRQKLADRGRLGRLPVLRDTTDVLVLPDEPSEYTKGAAMQTLRRKVRVATRLGVEVVELDRLDERRAWLAAAVAAIGEPLRAMTMADSDLELGMWLGARAADGRRLLLSVTPTSGRWAVLRYFRTFDGTDEAGTARYLVSQVLAERLAGQGIRYLVNTVAPFALPSGLRHFQKMLGWRTYRVVVDRR